MRRVLALLALTALVLAGCSGDDSSSGTTTTKASGDGSTTTTADSGDDGGSGGDVDCDAVKAAFADFIVPVQLLAQARTLDQLQAIKDGTIGDYDADDFLAAVATLRVLENHKGVLGDPKEALDKFEAAGEKMKALLEESAPTEAEVQEYVDSIGSITDFLSQQGALSAAMDDAGC